MLSYHLRMFLLTLSLSLTSMIQSNLAPGLQFPCNSPHNSYPFCDTSLPISTRSHSLLSLLTLPEKISALCNNFTGIPKLGIPPYEWWSESLHGIATNGPGVTFSGGPIKSATMFPQVILTAASFNLTLWGEIASSIAVEGRAMYNYGQAGLTYWAPNINIFRDPRWGRGQETLGEDPMVASAFAVEYVKGFQGGGGGGTSKVQQDGWLVNRRVLDEVDGGSDELVLSACCKHFTAYDLDKWGNFSRYSFNAEVNEQDMEDTYQPPFKSCIQEGKASCLMCSYNSVNGIPACASRDLLDKARVEWGFNGYVTSDCDAVATISEYHHYVKTPEDAVAIALKAGTDINCGTYMLRHTAKAIDQGKVQEEDVNKAVLNLLNVLMRLGLFNGSPSNGMFGKLGPQDVCSDKHKKLALDAARQGIVLLKNENKFLPWNKDSVPSLAVIGPGANDSSQLGGGYSGFPCNSVTYLEGLQSYIRKTTFTSGCKNVTCSSSSGFDEAVNIARRADYVVVVIGLDLSQETEDMDRTSLLPPGKQRELVTSIAAVCKNPLVLVVTGGGPLDILFAKEDPQIASILWVGYPGEKGGEALGNIVFGDHNPGGRLTMSWYPESYTKIPMNDMNMRANPSRDYPGRTYRFYTGEIIYNFGYGLSYTSYKHKLLYAPKTLKLLGYDRQQNNSLQHDTIKGSGGGFVHVDEVTAYCNSLRFTMHISVVNEGEMDGAHVVLLFWKGSNVMVPAGCPRKQLVGFSKVHTRAAGYGDSGEAQISVDPCKHLSFADESGRRILGLGEHVLMTEEGVEHSLVIEL